MRGRSRPRVEPCQDDGDVEAPSPIRGRRHVGSWAGRYDTRVVIAALVVGIGVLLLVWLGHYVSAHETHRLDRDIVLMFRAAGDPTNPIGPRWLEEIGRDLTALGGIATLTLLTTSTLCYAWMRREKVTAWVIVASVVGAVVLSSALKIFYGRARPDFVTHHSIVYSKSFPSGHSMLAAATYLTLAAILVRLQPNRRLKLFIVTVACVLTGLTGVSRVYLGVHWPSDVLAGWAAGAAWAALVWFSMRRQQRVHGIVPTVEGVPED